MSIDSYLHELANTAAPLKSGRLINLSTLSDDERDRFAALWPTLPVERRRTVLERLAELAEDNPELDFDAVFLTALDDADAAVRRLAIEGLWERRERDVIPPLIRLMRSDPEPAVRAEAALALGRFVLMGEFGDLRPRDTVAVTDALRETVTDPAEFSLVRGRALEAVGASSQPWARDLIQDAYDSADERMVVSAIHAMGRSADAYWVPTLLDELHSADAEVRYEAAGALGEIEDEEALPHLAELIDDEDSEVRDAAIRAIGEIGGAEACDILRQYVDDPDEQLRSAAQAALEQAEFGDDPMGLRLS
jgi:HEAT repeat protein